MNITGIIGHIIRAASDQNTLDRYGFQKTPRRNTYNRTVTYTIRSESANTTYTVKQFDEISESAQRRHGNFIDPTPYSIAQTQIRGRQAEPCKVSSNYPKYSMKSHLISCSIPRKGSVDAFGLLLGTSGKAASLLNGKCLDAANQWSAAVDAAELGQTVGLFRDLSQRFLGISAGIAKRDPRLILQSFGVDPTRKRRRHVLRTIERVKRRRGTVGDAAADLWLQYRYGIRPLCYSLQDYQAALTKGYDPKFVAQVTVPERISWIASDSLGSGPGYKVRLVEAAEAGRSVRYRATFSFRDSLQARILGNPLGLALGTAWELLPYSFVLDWIVKVGDWINQLNLESLVADYRCVKTVKGYTRFTSTATIVADANYPNARVTYNDLPKIVSETRSFSREIVGTPPSGSLLWGTGLSGTLRLLDAASLTFSKVRRTNASYFK